MKKILTLLFAFTCLAFSEMRGQVQFVVYNQSMGQNVVQQEMSSVDGVHFSLSSVVIAPLFNDNSYGYFYYTLLDMNGSPIQNVNKIPYNFPKGVAIDYSGQIPYIIPPGTYRVLFNKSTSEFSFTGGSYRTFDDCGIWVSECNKLAAYLNTSFTSFQWKRNGEIIPGATSSDYIHPSSLPEGNYNYTCDAFSPDSGAVLTSNTVLLSTTISVTAQFQNASDFCSNRQFSATINQPGSDWIFQWKKDGQAVTGATQSNYNAPPQQQASTYSCLVSCPNNNASKETNSLSVPGCFGDSTSGINYLLVQNVITTGNNAANKTIQVQFDLSWGNTWWDDINWDAAWVFVKYKTASGEWKHAKINPTGFDKGQGSPSIIQPTADKMGAFVRLGQKGQGNFNAEGMQLQWNYGLDGLNSVNGLEVKVFATEMVYQPQGDFSIGKFRINTKVENNWHPDTLFDFNLTTSGKNTPVINSRLTPKLSAYGISGIRIKGDAGLDLDSNGTIDNTTYPTGYYPFYLFKYEMSEQQYSDFLSCLSPAQVANLGIAGTSITLNQGQYFAASPNRACKGANAQRLLAYADWSGLRPATFLELQKAYNGPNSPNIPFFNLNPNNGLFESSPKQSVSRFADVYNGIITEIPFNASGKQGRCFYGSKDLIGNVWEPLIALNSTDFIPNHGDGEINSLGMQNQQGWSDSQLSWGNFMHNNSIPVPDQYQGGSECRAFMFDYYSGNYNPYYNFQCYGEWGFRLCRSAE